MGAPYESLPRQGKPVLEMTGGGLLDLAPGKWTDDTGLMLALAEAIIEKGIFEREIVLRHYLRWLDSRPIGIGQTTAISLSLVKEGKRLEDAVLAAHRYSGGLSAGNGTIMRSAPIALIDCSDQKRLETDSIADAKITHWDDRAAYGSVALNTMIARAALGERDKADIIQAGAKAVVGKSGEVEKCVAEAPEKGLGELRSTGFVLDTLEAAVWMFARIEGFEECLSRAVALGGDADTVGAVSGALAGAYYGAGDIPGRWKDVLDERERIIEAAQGIYSLHLKSQKR